METLSQVTTCDELARAIDVLAEELSAMRETGRVSFPDVQRLASSLTRAQLALNAMERLEASERGLGGETAERLAACGKSIQLLRFEIYRELRRGTQGGSEADR